MCISVFWLETGVLFRVNVFFLLLLGGFDVILMCKCIQIQMFRELSLSRFWLGRKGCGRKILKEMVCQGCRGKIAGICHEWPLKS